MNQHHPFQTCGFLTDSFGKISEVRASKAFAIYSLNVSHCWAQTTQDTRFAPGYFPPSNARAFLRTSASSLV